MTREEAIANLKMISVAFVGPVTKEQGKLIDDTFDMAINALEQQPCEDAISRQAVLEIVERELNQGDALFEIENMSSVQPQPKTGHWIKTKEQDDAEPLILWKCSECLTVQRLKTNYCPNCGTKMEEQK